MIHLFNPFITWIKSIFQSKAKENIFAVTCGDVVFFHMLGVPPEVSVLADKMFSTMILAALGGAAGWAGKELIIWVWKYLKPLFMPGRKKKRLNSKTK